MKSFFTGLILLLLLASCHHTDPIESLSVNLQPFNDTTGQNYISTGATYSLSKKDMNKGIYILSVVAGNPDSAYILIDTSFIALASSDSGYYSDAKHEYINHYANKYYELTLDVIETKVLDESAFYEGLMTLKAKNMKQVTKHIYGFAGD